MRRVEIMSRHSGQYGHSYGYQSGQQNVPLPGQLQPTATIQPNLPGQSAQLHVAHHTPPGGVQTVHQTQVAAFGQTATGAQQVQNVTREYVVQTPGGMTGQQIHQGIHQNPAQGQVHAAIPEKGETRHLAPAKTANEYTQSAARYWRSPKYN